MDGTSGSSGDRYQLPAWFLKSNVRIEADLANTPSQMVFCTSSCDGCKESKTDDEYTGDDTDTTETPGPSEESTGDPKPGAPTQENLRNTIHYKTFVELRDTILAHFVFNQDGKLARPEDLGVVFRVKEGDTHVWDTTWMYQVGVLLAKAMGVSLVTLDFEDMEELACAFYHQDQEKANGKGADGALTTYPDPSDTRIDNNDTDEPRTDEPRTDEPRKDAPQKDEPQKDAPQKDEAQKDDGSLEEVWKPDMGSFTTFLDHYFATRSKRKATAASTCLNQQALSTILEAFGSTSGACPSDGYETSTRPVIVHIVECTELYNELDGWTRRRVFARFGEALQARREKGQAIAMLVSTEDWVCRPGEKIYSKMKATKGSAVDSTIDKIDKLELRGDLRRRAINIRRLRRCLREQAAHLFPCDLIDVSADWNSAQQVDELRAFGKELWSSYEICRAKTQLVGRGWKKRTLGYADIAAVLRRVGILKTDPTNTPETESENQVNDPLDSVDLNEHEESLRECVVSRDKLSLGWNDVIVDDETKELMQEILSSYRFEVTSESDFLLQELRVGGALLYGPPGTGKTHLSRAVAKASGSHMLAVDGARLQSKWLGESEKLVQAAFTLAAKLFPCVLFIDEVDSIFYRRSSENKSWERAFLTQFLQQLDGITKDEKSPLVIVATNRPWDLDEAFLRRLPLKLYFGLPHTESRARILRLFLKEGDLDPAVDIDGLARATENYSGSDLKSLCTYAALAWRVEERRRDSPLGDSPTTSPTASRGSKKLRLTVDHFVKALDRIQPNDAKDLVQNLDKFSRKYNPRASKSERNTDRVVYNDLTKRREVVDVRKLISRPAPPEKIPTPNRSEQDNGMQVQAWCQLDLREHFIHLFHLYLASRLGVVQDANGLQSPSSLMAGRISLQEEAISSEEHGLRSESLEGDGDLPEIEGKEPLSTKRLKYHVEQTIRQIQRGYAACDSGQTLYTSDPSSPIFLIEPYFETGITEDEGMPSYHPLPSTTSIRLLKLEPVRTWLGRGSHDLDLITDPIRCGLIVQELEDCPSFDALSYTWSDPCTVYSSQDWRPSRERPASLRQAAWSAKTLDIFVDGKPVSVGPNLYLALQAIRAKWSQSLQGGADDAACFSGSIWVDALCINQQDLAEKSVQVMMMSRIYKEAQNVWCWLGGEDSLCGQAFVDLSNMAKAIADSHGEFNDSFSMRWSGYDLNDPQTYHDFGMPVMTDKSWIGIYTLLNRAWFKRAWIVQEICFAKNPVFLCGHLELKLHPIMCVLTFLFSSKWAVHMEYVTDGKVRLPCEAEQSSTDKGCNDSATSTTLFRSRESDTADYNWAPIVMLHRIALGLETRYKTAVKTPRRADKVEITLSSLLAYHRSAEAGDPRDKVYAFLGMAEDNHGPGKLIADYSLPVRTVYTLAMKFLLESTGTLDAFSLRENVRQPLYELTAEGRKEQVELPTWVPNFNAQHFTVAFDRHMASEGLDPPQIQFLDTKLIVFGFQVGSITSCLEFDRDRLFELAQFLEGVAPQTEVYYSEGFNVYANGSDETSNYDQPPLYSTVMQSRLEVLWRTLCHDSYKSIYPAPSNCGDIFTESLQHFVACAEHQCVLFMLGRQEKADPSKRKIGTDFSAFRNSQEALDFIARAYTGLQMLTNQVDPNANYELTCSPELLGLLGKIESDAVDASYCISEYLSFRSENIWPSKQVMDLNFEFQRANQKMLVTTNSGHLGLAPSLVQEGDEVWVLAGSNAPSILRPTPVDGEYELVGQTYVHSIMYGEAVRDRPVADSRSITIV